MYKRNKANKIENKKIISKKKRLTSRRPHKENMIKIWVYLWEACVSLEENF